MRCDLTGQTFARLQSLLGEAVESRRSFIQRNAKDVRFLDI